MSTTSSMLELALARGMVRGGICFNIRFIALSRSDPNFVLIGLIVSGSGNIRLKAKSLGRDRGSCGKVQDAHTG
jgi:hypothetical protein